MRTLKSLHFGVFWVCVVTLWLCYLIVTLPQNLSLFHSFLNVLLQNFIKFTPGDSSSVHKRKAGRTCFHYLQMFCYFHPCFIHDWCKVILVTLLYSMVWWPQFIYCQRVCGCFLFYLTVSTVKLLGMPINMSMHTFLGHSVGLPGGKKFWPINLRFCILLLRQCQRQSF